MAAFCASISRAASDELSSESSPYRLRLVFEGFSYSCDRLPYLLPLTGDLLSLLRCLEDFLLPPLPTSCEDETDRYRWSYSAADFA